MTGEGGSSYVKSPIHIRKTFFGHFCCQVQCIYASVLKSINHSQQTQIEYIFYLLAGGDLNVACIHGGTGAGVNFAEGLGCSLFSWGCTFPKNVCLIQDLCLCCSSTKVPVLRLACVGSTDAHCCLYALDLLHALDDAQSILGGNCFSLDLRPSGMFLMLSWRLTQTFRFA